jgi:hypothetical protein
MKGESRGNNITDGRQPQHSWNGQDPSDLNVESLQAVGGEKAELCSRLGNVAA